jgi:hypothetical protein
MLGPFELQVAGTPKWAECLGARIEAELRHTKTYGIERIEPLIALALDTEPHPWDNWPVGRPCRTPNRFFEYAAETSCKSLAQLIAAQRGDDYPLVRRLLAATAVGEVKIADENELRGKKIDLHDDVMKVTERGTSKSYLLRRLARERPDLLAAYERGEFKTPTAAAREAGFVKEVTALDKLRRDWAQASAKERRIFLAEVTRQ